MWQNFFFICGRILSAKNVIKWQLLVAGATRVRMIGDCGSFASAFLFITWALLGWF
jgi:hypothetical protein